MLNAEDGNFNKFVVINIKFLQRLSMTDQLSLHRMIGKLNKRIPELDKKRYIVINQDESYADEVIEILKKNGHWG